MNPPLGLYVHWPYCARICPYCDFNVVRDRGQTQESEALAAVIVADIAAHAAFMPGRRLRSIFFGGGTPSLMRPDDVARVVEAAKAAWTPSPDLEVTLESNPTDAESARFAAFAAAGVGRLSLGVQSLADDELKFLGRNHDAADARRALETAANHFPRVSADLIYALPGQTPQGWTSALREIAAFGVEHISPYQLTIEAGTAFDRAVRRGAFQPPADDLAAALFEATGATLARLGYDAYEVSNHARGVEARSRHNLIYWRGHDYVGVGPGAHGRLTLGGHRHSAEAPRSIAAYSARVAAGGIGARLERLAPREQALERLLMGLRTTEGVRRADLAPLAIAPERISGLSDFLHVNRGRLVATARGRSVLDRVVAELADAA